MAATSLKRVTCPPNSASLDEARKQVLDFFKLACRSIPTIMDVYNLHDVVTPSQLRATVASQIRKNSNLTNPKVIDLLVFKGMEELSNLVSHIKQRHHVMGQYVVGRQGLVHDLDPKDEGISDFLKNFYQSNYF
ncbi:NADH dehydrogenase [Tripterygium wilfordii]|uniref:NADH dehydrogenase n=1 Tax=Tripterygium wilfordii TaxID=458696 RepID=A0A7J7C5E7_TRIWF|nr:NADH dehydrogenase [ubiquinone] 1 alpha subcomplex subunit 6-like [Tripterygium wilfordii]KAF5729332.1 NADH dehydrogenase [Tripterygium wilfordii]